MHTCEISIEFSIDHLGTARRLHGEILEVLKKYQYLFDTMPALETFEDVNDTLDDDDDDDDDEWDDD